MFRVSMPALLASATLLVLPVAVRPGADSSANAYARNMGSGELVGRVVNTSSKVMGRRIQVRAGSREWTLHVPDNTPVMNGRREVSIHDVDVGTYVRAIGTRIGTTRLKASRVYVIGDRMAFARSGYGRPSKGAGYYAAYAGYRGRYNRSR